MGGGLVASGGSCGIRGGLGGGEGGRGWAGKTSSGFGPPIPNDRGPLSFSDSLPITSRVSFCVDSEIVLSATGSTSTFFPSSLAMALNKTSIKSWRKSVRILNRLASDCANEESADSGVNR